MKKQLVLSISYIRLGISNEQFSFVDNFKEFKIIVNLIITFHHQNTLSRFETYVFDAMTSHVSLPVAHF
jgi:hypothetical protein